MDSESRSLPEEKALWPAAVSPPSSGLLGSEVFNYEKLIEGRRNRFAQATAQASLSPRMKSSDPSAFSPSMSPLNNLSSLHLESPAPVSLARSSASRDEKVARAGSADTVPEEDEEEEDLMEDVARSSTTTSATRTTSSAGRSSATNGDDADSPGRHTHLSSSSSNNGGVGGGSSGGRRVDEEDDEAASMLDEDRELERDQSPSSGSNGEGYGRTSGGDMLGEMDE